MKSLESVMCGSVCFSHHNITVYNMKKYVYPSIEKSHYAMKARVKYVL